jgi:choline transport protein
MGWQTGSAASAFLAGTELQALILLNHEQSYDPKPWHGTLIVIVVAAFCGIFNTFLARKLPLVEGTVLILHILGFFAILIPLWVLAPRSPAQKVFTQFADNGWGSTGLSCLVGMLAPTVSFLGSDAATHMSEVKQTPRISQNRNLLTVVIIGASRCLVYTPKGNAFHGNIQRHSRICNARYLLLLYW